MNRGASMYDEDEEKGVICDGCNQRRNRLRFSNKQWNDFTQRKYAAKSQRQDPAKVRKPTCRGCNGEPAMDKKCVGCEKELPLDKFSKNARKNKDNARCIDCTQEREDLEADPVAAVKEQRIYDHLEAQGGGSAWSMKSIASALPSELGSRFGYDSVSNTGTNPRSDFEKVWIQDESKDRVCSDQTPSSASSVSGITERSQKAPASVRTLQSNGTWEGFTPIERSFPTGRRQASTTATSNTGFAKQGAYRDDMVTRVHNKWQNDQKKQKEAEEEAEDSDESRSSESEFEL